MKCVNGTADPGTKIEALLFSLGGTEPGGGGNGGKAESQDQRRKELRLREERRQNREGTAGVAGDGSVRSDPSL